jgi:hypothetical protein
MISRFLGAGAVFSVVSADELSAPTICNDGALLSRRTLVPAIGGIAQGRTGLGRRPRNPGRPEARPSKSWTTAHSGGSIWPEDFTPLRTFRQD